MIIDNYIDLARSKNNFRSDRKLSLALGVNVSLAATWRTRRAWPSDKIMVKLALLCELDPAEALLDLNIWRSDGVAVSIYTSMRKAMNAAMVALFIIIAGQAVTPTNQAFAVEKPSNLYAVDLYYGKSG